MAKASSMVEDDLLKVVEPVDTVVGKACSLISVVAADSEADVRRLNHVGIVGAVTNCGDYRPFEVWMCLQHIRNLSLLSG